MTYAAAAKSAIAIPALSAVVPVTPPVAEPVTPPAETPNPVQPAVTNVLVQPTAVVPVTPPVAEPVTPPAETPNPVQPAVTNDLDPPTDVVPVTPSVAEPVTPPAETPNPVQPAVTNVPPTAHPVYFLPTFQCGPAHGQFTCRSYSEEGVCSRAGCCQYWHPIEVCPYYSNGGCKKPTSKCSRAHPRPNVIPVHPMYMAPSVSGTCGPDGTFYPYN